MLRVPWDVEEIVAFIDLYERMHGNSDNLDGELQNFSKTLIYRAKKLNILHDDMYRNYNGMKMMYQNVEYIASNGKHGLSGASKAFCEVYKMKQSCPYVFELILGEFNQRFVNVDQNF